MIDLLPIEGKFQYDDSIIKVLVGNTQEYLDSTTDEEEVRNRSQERARDKEALREAQADDVERQLQDVIDGVPFREMARRYGRDYIKNWRSYKEYASNVVFEETLDIQKALAVQSSLLEQAQREREMTALTSGYTAGSKDALFALQQYVDAEVENGATYLKDISKLITTMKNSI